MERNSLKEACEILTDACQLLDSIKAEWQPEGSWSEWDQSVRDAASEWLLLYHGAHWTCKARKGNAGANDPQDCDWPTCGCDPYADKVIESLQESGKLK